MINTTITSKPLRAQMPVKAEIGLVAMIASSVESRPSEMSAESIDPKATDAATIKRLAK